MFLTKDKQSPYYQIVYFVDGKRTKKSTKKTAKSEALKVLKKFEQTFNGHIPVKHNIYLSEFQKRYVEYSEQSKAQSYIKSINLSFRQLLRFTSDVNINNLSVRMLDQFIAATYSRSMGAAGLYYRTLKAAFSKAVVWEYIQENPFKKIKAPKQVKSLPIFINKIELQCILDNTKHQFLKDVFITGFYSGCRLSELLNMRWAWIDFQRKIITVKNSTGFTTKNKKERIIPIHSNVEDVLLSRYKSVTNIIEDEFVFSRFPQIKLNEYFVSKQFKKAVRQAGLNDAIHFHNLRHSFASNLVQAGSSLYVVKELLGHVDYSTTQIYSHLQKQNLSEAVNLLH